MIYFDMYSADLIIMEDGFIILKAQRVAGDDAYFRMSEDQCLQLSEALKIAVKKGRGIKDTPETELN